MKRQRVTMRDVAERARVSINTVSLTLKGSSLVHPNTRAAVIEAVAALGYVPNHTAQNLRQGLVRTIGLMLPDLQNPHYWDIAAGVEQEATGHGYGVVIASSNLSAERELASLRGLLERRYDGLILATHFLPDGSQDEAQPLQLPQVREFLRHGHPIVTLGATWQGADRVRYYQRRAGLLLLEHLFALGHRRIGFVVGVAREGLADERLRAYDEFVAANSLPAMLERCGPTVADSEAAAGRLLAMRLRPTAIIAVNDYLALGVLRAAARRGMQVPQELSVAGFDNTPLGASLAPALTSVDVGGGSIGQTAASLLFERLADPERADRVVELPARLVIRESTARAAPPGKYRGSP